MIEEIFIKTGFKTSDGKIFGCKSQAEVHEALYQRIKDVYCQPFEIMGSHFERIGLNGRWWVIKPSTRNELDYLIKYYTNDHWATGRSFSTVKYGWINFMHEVCRHDGSYVDIFSTAHLLYNLKNIVRIVEDQIVSDKE